MALRVKTTYKNSDGIIRITREAPEWKYLNDGNDVCPGCGKRIYSYDKNVEYSRTKRGTHVFWHTECTGKAWH